MTWILFFGLIFMLNFLGLLWCYLRQSDRLTDLIYSLSFLLASVGTLVIQQDFSLAKLLLVTMVSLWSIRLGAYLFIRIHFMKSDKRFDQMRKKFSAIAGFWLLQTISIYIIALPVVFFLNKSIDRLPSLSYLAIGIWAIGWFLESISDYQKFRFRNNPAHKNNFVDVGVWKYLQHPNYLGEILCWVGIWLYTMPYLSGLEWFTIISPLWIIILLVFISGIPLLQKSSAKRYGHLPKYLNYNKKVAKLIPFIW
ncbi:MAG: DUF1295 domain-containing protein [Aureispira sp.]|nr:DUF1295 domain-containing protein [Aureispira sp.]